MKKEKNNQHNNNINTMKRRSKGRIILIRIRGIIRSGAEQTYEAGEEWTS